MIPDFLSHHIPEGFTADGAGDVTTLKFEADSDDGEDEGADAGGGGWGAGESGQPAGWGAAPAASQPSGWGESAAPVEQTYSSDVPRPSSAWGAQHVVAQSAPIRPGPAVDAWGTTPAPEQAAPADNSGISGWGTTATGAQTKAVANSSTGWANGGTSNSQSGAW